MDDASPCPGPGAPLEPVIVAKPGHPISKPDIDADVLKIVYRLHRLGFTAYITGGAVRDLLLGRPAKDFDIVTDARPGQIKKRFGNAYVIGRRFRLVHVHFRGEKVIEVATFRRAADRDARAQAESEGAPVNPYGTPAEDAFRRDITINALFYDVINDAVLDYVGGLGDLSRRVVRVIGDPEERFVEDPVRIWRVLRHSSRLGFAIDESAERAIVSHAQLVGICSGARLYEEFNRDLTSETRPVIEALRRFGLLHHVVGKTGLDYEADPELFSRLSALLEVKDRAGAAGLEFSLMELYSLFFWPWIEPLFSRTGIDYHKELSDAFRDAGMKVNIPKSLRADVFQTVIIVAAMLRAMHTGKMRWALQRRSQFAKASRLFSLIFFGRPPEGDESFAAAFNKAHPAAGKPWKRRRRRSHRLND
jgi:poly(A) polymerase